MLKSRKRVSAEKFKNSNYSQFQQECIGIDLTCKGWDLLLKKSEESNEISLSDNEKRLLEKCSKLEANTDTGEIKDEIWKRQWTPNCIDLYGNILNGWRYDIVDNERKFSLEGLKMAQTDFDYLFSKIYNEDTSNRLVPVNQIGYDPFQDVLLDACRQLPGVCQEVQNQMCKNENGDILSREIISSTAPLVSMCGCMANPMSQIVNTEGISITDDITPECDPLCAQQLSIRPLVGDPISPTYITNTKRDSNYPIDIKKSSRYGYSPECQASICVIDAVSINATNSTTGGTSFTQVCSGCSKNPNAPCKCIVNFTQADVATNVQDSDLSNSVIFNQHCPGAICMVIDDKTSKIREVPCGTYLGDGVSKAKSEIPVLPTPSIPKIIWIVAIAVVLIFLIGFFAIWYANRHLKVMLPMVMPDLTRGVGPDGRLSSVYI